VTAVAGIIVVDGVHAVEFMLYRLKEIALRIIDTVPQVGKHIAQFTQQNYYSAHTQYKLKIIPRTLSIS
jgi:hypothetical protein